MGLLSSARISAGGRGGQWGFRSISIQHRREIWRIRAGVVWVNGTNLLDAAAVAETASMASAEAENFIMFMGQLLRCGP